jgi:hypothetical protein
VLLRPQHHQRQLSYSTSFHSCERVALEPGVVLVLVQLVELVDAGCGGPVEVSNSVLWVDLASLPGQALKHQGLLVVVASFVPFACPGWAQVVYQQQDGRRLVLVRRLVDNPGVFESAFEQDDRPGDAEQQ